MTPAQIIFATKFPGLVARGAMRYFASPPLTPTELDKAANQKSNVVRPTTREERAAPPPAPVSTFKCNQRWEKDRVPPIEVKIPAPITPRPLADNGLQITNGKLHEKVSKADTLQIVVPPVPRTATLSYQRERQRDRAIYAARKAAGLCYHCDEPVAMTLHGKPGICCVKHREMNREYQRKLREGTEPCQPRVTEQ